MSTYEVVGRVDDLFYLWSLIFFVSRLTPSSSQFSESCTMITTSLRSTSRALHGSSRCLTMGRSGASRFFVGSHSIENTRRDVDATVSPRRSIFQTSTHPVPLYSSYSLHKTLPKIRPVEGNDSSCRYFSKESPDGTDIDRSKFTVEVPIEMPDMGDDLEGGCNSCPWFSIIRNVSHIYYQSIPKAWLQNGIRKRETSSRKKTLFVTLKPR